LAPGHRMIDHVPIPLLNPTTCVEHGFVYFGALNTPNPAPYWLYKDTRYLVIQSESGGPHDTAHQLVIPRAAILWLTHLVRHPFMRREGHEESFEGETLILRRNTTLTGDGITGFEIQNTSRRTGPKAQLPQRAIISDEFMHECLVPFMDGLTNGT
ncbi:MAG TPA: hypothetical protein PKE57_05120, partial [Cellvibrionaceae bacterium]|nr:hypothetical protein [Cellvibrionaceae bacterium]